MRIGTARSFSHVRGRPPRRTRTVLGSVLGAFLLTAGLVAVGGAPAQAETDRSPQPVSSSGGEVDEATMAALEEVASSGVVPATAPTRSPAEVGADFDEEEVPTGTADVAPLTVIGDDQRTRTTPTDWWPASSTVQFTYLDNGVRTQYCTGFMISPDTVATAGHCVYNEDIFDGDHWASDRGFRAYPGADGSDHPYGSCAAEEFLSVDFWTEDGNSEYDFGAVKLDCEVGDATGTYGYGTRSDDDLEGNGVATRGYPCDRAYGTQWAGYGQILEVHDRQLFHQIDNFGCQSGSPVYEYNDDACGGPCALSVDAYGCAVPDGEECNTSDEPFTNHNYGTRITGEVFEFFQAWSVR